MTDAFGDGDIELAAAEDEGLLDEIEARERAVRSAPVDRTEGVMAEGLCRVDPAHGEAFVRGICRSCYSWMMNHKTQATPEAMARRAKIEAARLPIAPGKWPRKPKAEETPPATYPPIAEGEKHQLPARPAVAVAKAPEANTMPTSPIEQKAVSADMSARAVAYGHAVQTLEALGVLYAENVLVRDFLSVELAGQGVVHIAVTPDGRIRRATVKIEMGQ
jgi:hypothetical protein